MARHSAGDLSARAGTLARRPEAGGSAALDPVAWADRSSASWSTFVLGGFVVLGAGLLGALTMPLPVVGPAVWGAFITMGSGLVFLGGLKARRKEEPRAMSASEQGVLVERGRRVRARIEEGEGDYTFERLVAELRWTDDAVLSALLHMKDTGDIIEDLNLDSGEWVYRVQHPDLATGGQRSLSLEERRRADDSDP